MDTKIRNYLGLALIAGVAVLGYAAIVFTSAYNRAVEPYNVPSFSVTAEGEVLAKPDVAKFDFSVITEGGKDIANLQETNTKKVNGAIAFLKENGVEEKDIKTTGYNIEPRYQYYGCTDGACPPADIVGYTIRQTIEVKVRDFGKTSNILSGVVGKGANSVSQLSFEVDDPTELQNQARAKAIAKAKSKAEAVAEAGGFKLGRLLVVEEYESQPPIIYGRDGYGGGGVGGDLEVMTPPTIEPGSEEIKVTVSLRYEID
ncbi:MAG: SIMPL domain-containing protein [Candidatus Colwellbacteria bacterium]|nr:SIMPL domain-containing protein [Candidatus Colwellbacteria bacterium]